MDFSHYTDQPVELATDLVNTLSTDGDDPLASLDGLRRFLEPYAGLWEEASLPPGDADLDPVRRLRASLREVFSAPEPDAAARLLNQILAENVAIPRISTHGGASHLHFEPLEPSFAQWLAVVTAMGLTTVLCDHGLERFGLCASDACDDAFIDTSRNRSRRHCSTTCSTRENVAAYRRRQRADA